MNSLLYIPDKQLIVSGSGDKTIRVWRYESNQCIQVIDGMDNVEEK